MTIIKKFRNWLNSESAFDKAFKHFIYDTVAGSTLCTILAFIMTVVWFGANFNCFLFGAWFFVSFFNTIIVIVENGKDLK